MKLNGQWNSKNLQVLAVFGLVPIALAIFGLCQPLKVWIRTEPLLRATSTLCVYIFFHVFD